jgi:hypothetical protein
MDANAAAWKDAGRNAKAPVESQGISITPASGYGPPPGSALVCAASRSAIAVYVQHPHIINCGQPMVCPGTAQKLAIYRISDSSTGSAGAVGEHNNTSQ